MAGTKLYAVVERMPHVVYLKQLKCVMGVLAADALAGTGDREANHSKTEPYDHA